MGMNFGSFASRVVATKVVATDGTGDFTDIQSAIDDLPSAGGVVYVKEGTYNITTRIAITSSNVAVIGSGRSTVIERDSSLGDTFTITSYKGILLDSFRMTGDINNTSGITMTDCTDSMINRIWSDSVNRSVLLDDCQNCTVSNCIFTSTKTIAIQSKGGATYPEGNNIIIGNLVISCELPGISALDSDHIVIANNVIKTSDQSGIDINASNHCSIIGNVASNNGQDALQNNLHGIWVRRNSDNNLFVGNVCENNGDYGIEIDSSTENKNIVIGNILENNTTGELNDNGTDTDTGKGDLGLVPVGGLISWLKSYTNTPALPAQFVECNGQTLSDADSVYDGQVIPNLNGNNNIVRGNSTSGGTGSEDLLPAHTHTTTREAAQANKYNEGTFDWASLTTSSTSSGTALDYYDVVWVIRIK